MESWTVGGNSTRISKLIRQGWLKRIKKGVYVITDLSSRGSLSISPLAIVNAFVEEAYVSFENSLQFHGIYDQLLSAVNAISLKQYSSTLIDQTTYNFIKTQVRYFYGRTGYVKILDLLSLRCNNS